MEIVMIPSTRNSSYQEGSFEKETRAKGPAVWVYRWRELQADRSRPQRKKVVGNIDRYPKLADAKRATENLRAEINARQEKVGKLTFGELWGHFQANELSDPEVDRSPTTIEGYDDNARLHMIPKWGDSFLDEIKAPAVEKWLRSLPFAPATKAKLRNHMSAIYSHAIRHDLYPERNPITSVRQGSRRQKIPELLEMSEMQAILAHLEGMVYRVAVLVDAVTALRRSELRGLQWADVDQGKLWLHLRRGVVRGHLTKLKNEGSRKGIPIPQDLADVLAEWRTQSPYPGDGDWVFASQTKHGKIPLWLDMVLVNHIRPAALAAGVTKRFAWHTFRHSLATLLGDEGEDVKVIQELLRHSSPTTTGNLYQQAGSKAKRAAQAHTSHLFIVKAN
jgi:integrase